MRPANLPSWFRPRATFDLHGQPWATDGRNAFSGWAPEPATCIPASAVVQLVATATEPVTSRSSRDGYAIMNGVHLPGFAVAPAEAAYPYIEWITGPTLAVGLVDDVPVAIVAAVRPDLIAGRCPPPKCGACAGEGGPDCPECDGTGEVEHSCSCGDIHEHECGKCGGAGTLGECKVCGGTGEWRPEHDGAGGVP